MTLVRLARRAATVLWEGDVIVLGAGWAGLNAALAAARKGHRTCLLEPGPELGVELTQQWVNRLPGDGLAREVQRRCAAHGTPASDSHDLLMGSIALDQILEEARVFSLVRVLPMRLVADDRGRLRGVEVVGKSGRQLVAAPIVIDATPLRRFTRRSAGQPAPALTMVERRLYVYGVAAPAAMSVAVPGSLQCAGNHVQVLPTVWVNEVLVVFRTNLAAGASTTDGFMGTLRTGTAVMDYLRESVAQFSGAILAGVSPAFRAEAVGAPAEAPALRAAGLYTLPLADTLEAEAAQAAAVVDKALTAPPPRPLPPEAATAALEGVKTAELTAATEQDLTSTVLPEAMAEQYAPVDVVVAGYGTAGAFAALSAAERGAKVRVLDFASSPGGIGTIGCISGYYYGVAGGVQDRIDAEVGAEGQRVATVKHGHHPAAKAKVLASALQKAGVDIRPGHTVFGAVLEGSRVVAVVSADEQGYHVFPCAAAIDATGDGDVAAAAGAGFRFGRPGDGFPQPYSYTPVVCNSEGEHGRNFDAGWVDPTDTLDYSRAHFEGRRQIVKQTPFSAARHYCFMAPLLGLRESRFIRGRASVTFDDFVDGRTFPDGVCPGRAHYDNHAMDYASESDWSRRYVALCGLWQRVFSGEIPYGALVPEGIEGLLVAGRAISVDHDLHQLFRMQQDLQETGAVCGVAAAMAARGRTTPGRVDPQQLRAVLKERGGLRGMETAPQLALPAEELVERLGTEDNGLAMWRLIQGGAGKAPDWNQFFGTETKPHIHLSGAVAAALSGAPSEPARAVLHQALRERWTEPRLGAKSPPLCVVAALALAEVHDGTAAEPTGALLREPFDPPTLVLVIKALEQLGDARGVAPIREFLRQKAGEAFDFPLWGCEEQWTSPFRFAVDLCAVRALHALGCRDEDARLDPYLRHPNLLIRRAARRLAACHG